MASVYTNLYFNQPLIVLDTTLASQTSASLLLHGGMNVRGNTLFSSVDISGIIQVKNTTQSTTTSNGALIVSGGVGISGNLNVGNDAVVAGNLTAGAFATDNMSVNNITTGVLLAGTRISTSNIYIGNSTITNLLGTTISASTLNLSTGVTSGVIFASSGSFSTIGTSWLNASTISGGNISLSGDLFVAGTVTTVNITSTNIVNTNVSAGVVLASTLLSAPGNSNTIGSIFTTGGNVGINNTNPVYTLDVTGDLRVSNSMTTSTLLANTSMTAGALFVTGGSLFQGDVSISGASVFNAGATAGALFITGGSLLQGDVTVSGASVFNAGVTTGALFVTGGSLFKGSVTVSGASVLNAGATVGALFVTGGALIKGDLGVTGASLFVGNVSMGSNVVVSGPALKIPTGDIAARPGTPQAGYVRYNSEIQQFEGYGPGNAWGSLGGVIDIAQTTKILASETPSTTDGNLYFITVGSERMRVNSAGNIGIGTSAPTCKLEVNGTSLISGNVTMGSNVVVAGPALKIPTGDISSRPGTPQAGYVRYNSEIQQFEGYGPGNAWGSLGGVIDIAQTTKVLASETPSTTDGNLYFITVNSERMRINSAGNIGIGTSAPTCKLDVIGTLSASTGITTASLVTNTVDMTPSLGDIIKERSFSAQNNQISEANITGLNFANATVRAFHAIVSVSIIKTYGANLYANYDLKGIQKDSGDWFLNVSFVGDDTGVIFGITNVSNTGQVQYISSNLANWGSTTIKFKANTTSV
jgi:hypothetical protein